MQLLINCSYKYKNYNLLVFTNLFFYINNQLGTSKIHEENHVKYFIQARALGISYYK